LRIARDGVPTIGTLACAAIAAYPFSCWITCVILLPLAMSLWFYRDPDRAPSGGPNAWVSPADGRIVELDEGAFDQYAGRATKIGIFMGGFDVHVNRFPADGEVEDKLYVPGKKWFAIHPKSSELNERLYVYVNTAQGRATLVQIAGIMARRIACRTKTGDILARGERYGMIKLGSKVDLYMPSAIRPVVKIGDRVRAGETIIGEVD
jgi:phosphatidylserine decarboxylase